MATPLLLLLLPAVHCVRVNCSITDHLYHPPRTSSTTVLSKSTILQILALLPVSSRASRVIDMKAKNIYFFFLCMPMQQLDRLIYSPGKWARKNKEVMPLPWTFHHFVYLLFEYQPHIQYLSTTYKHKGSDKDLNNSALRLSYPPWIPLYKKQTYSKSCLVGYGLYSIGYCCCINSNNYVVRCLKTTVHNDVFSWLNLCHFEICKIAKELTMNAFILQWG